MPNDPGARLAARALTFVTVPLRAVLRVADWLLEEPLRAALSPGISLLDLVRHFDRHVTIPDVWDDARPPLRPTWDWARNRDLDDDEPLRPLAARIAVGATVPLRAVLLFVDWLLEHPSRAAVATVDVLVAWQIFT